MADPSQDFKLDPSITLTHPHYGVVSFFAVWGGFVHGQLEFGGILEMEVPNFLTLARSHDIEFTAEQSALIEREATNA
jgi:hypothetical protein